MVSTTGGLLQCCCEAGLRIPSLGSEIKTVDFVIDTGSDRTILQPADARNAFDLPMALLENERAWERVAVVTGVSAPAMCYGVPAELVLQHTDGRVQELPLQLYIMKPTQYNLTLPSLLGWDVLRRFELRLNWNRLAVSLLRPEEA